MTSADEDRRLPCGGIQPCDMCLQVGGCAVEADEMGRAGGADLAEIRCVGDVHIGCDHDPDRRAALDNAKEA